MIFTLISTASFCKCWSESFISITASVEEPCRGQWRQGCLLWGHCVNWRSTTKRRALYTVCVGDNPTHTSSVTSYSRIYFSSMQTCVFKLLSPCSVSSGVCSSAVVGFFFFSLFSGVRGVLHTAGLPSISRNYWSAAFDISIANLIWTRVLPRAAKFQNGTKEIVFPLQKPLADTAVKWVTSWSGE